MRRIVLLPLLMAATLPAAAQVLDRPTLFRLEPGSAFKRGCFEPCLCPMQETTPLKGTFRLELITVGAVFDFYEVNGVRFKANLNSTGPVTITGSGTYALSTIVDLQRMQLTLTVGNEPPTVYYADDQPGGAHFPHIVLPISIHGIYCFDTVLELVARPARRLYAESSSVWWDPEPNALAASYDVARGDLRTLRATGGGFQAATWDCIADGSGATAVGFDDDPAPGEGFWFLQRASGGSYADDDAAQAGSPDPWITVCD